MPFVQESSVFFFFYAYSPVVLCVCPVAELVREVFAQGGGGRVRAGPVDLSASITCIMRGQVDWWACSHWTTQTQKQAAT